MVLAAKSRIGPYEILSTLGVGGMGEVYRAHDPRLNRNVAIKVLRGDFAATPEQKARFEREARAIAALNHPNIVAIFEFGTGVSTGAGTQYIVSELIHGESLRDIMSDKPVPVRRLVDIAAQIADGLAAAHAGGIIHRDLKPENILLTKAGRVKILDFGLARQVPGAVGPDSGETTVSGNGEHRTNTGAILGTASYMSPEQAAGKQIDHRSDQFSLGLVLHEMVSGNRAFPRGNNAEIMAAIIRDEPPPINQKIPTPLKWIIDRCLSKQPEQRYESTRDLYHDLRNLHERFSEIHPTSGVAASIAVKARFQRWAIAAVLAVCAIAASLLGYWARPVGEDIGSYRFAPFASGASNAIWSPDGKAVAYSARVNGTSQVFLRYLRSPVPLKLTHEVHDIRPLGWSSDQSHLILLETTDRQQSPIYRLYSVATIGGELDFVMDSDCDACDLSRNGKTLATFAKGKDGSYGVAISDPLGSPLRPYSPAPFASQAIFNEPQMAFSPDGKRILLFRTGEEDRDEAWLLPFPSGSALPQRVLKTLPTHSFGWMPDNRHITISLNTDQNAPSHLWIADVSSTYRAPLTTGSVSESSPRVSPDGKMIIYTQSSRQLDVVSVSVQDGSTRTAISTGREETMPAWSVDKEKLAWVSNRSGPYEIWMRTPDGSEREAVTAADFPQGTNKWFFNPSFSPEGDRLLYLRIDQAGAARLWISSLSGGAPIRLTDTESGGEGGGSWAPDGSRIAYLQTLGGSTSLMIVRATGNARPIVVREKGPSLQEMPQGAPEWSPTGKWITYRDQRGWNLVSPDGKASRFLGKIETPYLAFSKDGNLLYGILTGEIGGEQDRAAVFSLNPMTLKQRVIKELGRDFRPDPTFVLGIRFSISPDGKSFIYSTGNYRSDLWMLQGYRQPGWTDHSRTAFMRYLNFP